MPIRAARSCYVEVRGLRYHLREWPSAGVPTRTVFLLHGWMDSSASFQFVVDHLPARWRVLAPDWRGFGLSAATGADSYWFPDYVADLDALLPAQPADLVGHSMGGNVAMLYAGARPERVRRLVNLEGYGMPPTQAQEAPDRLRQWLDEITRPAEMRGYDTIDAVADRLRQTNRRLDVARARYLAEHWSTLAPDGRRRLLADAAHRRVNPVLYRVDEVVAVWQRIRAPVLLVRASDTDRFHRFANTEEYAQRLASIPALEIARVEDSGHMLHHDQPQAVAALIEEFVSR